MTRQPSMTLNELFRKKRIYKRSPITVYCKRMIFGEIFFQRVTVDRFNAFLNVPIHLLIFFTFGDILELADAIFRQKR